jgi:uncharacterized protein YbaR (Trm112 family)
MTETETPKIAPEFIEILRCPEAVQSKEFGDDPGKLKLVNEYWLVSEESNNKYPIYNGIPDMVIEVGQQWKDTPVDDLPVPPPEKS